MRKAKQAPYTAKVVPMPGAKGTHLYDIYGPHGWLLGGQYTGTKEQAEKHVGKTLKRLNSTAPHGRQFQIRSASRRAA